MLRLRDGQSVLWEALLPPQVKLLSPELAEIDALLDDDRLLAPFVARFACPIGRPTVPIETYLRLMYLKHRYGLGYETLVKEVADSLSWRRFCRLALDGEVPHPTTLLKLTRRFGPIVVEELNEAVLKTAVERKLLRSRRLRADTTVMEADIRRPTDSGLCAHAITRLSRGVRRIRAFGLASRTRFQDRSRSAGKIARRISHSLGRAHGRAAIDRLTGEMHRLAKAALRQASRVLGNARRGLRQKRRGAAAVVRLNLEVQRAERVIQQTARRLLGERVIADRLISLCDVDARPIRRGRPQEPNEFGYKLSVADTAEGFVVAHEVYLGNPADASTLQTMVARAKAIGMKVRTVLADRGYGNEVGDQALAAEGIKHKVIPRVGKADPVEATSAWRRRYRFRAGCEGRISQLKRRGLRRARLKGYLGAEMWAGYGVLAHNLDRIVALR
jgi:IS5 family transposase